MDAKEKQQQQQQHILWNQALVTRTGRRGHASHHTLKTEFRAVVIVWIVCNRKFSRWELKETVYPWDLSFQSKLVVVLNFKKINFIFPGKDLCKFRKSLKRKLK